MKLLVGLGNPGSKFENSRHNAGWIFLDHAASQLNLDVDWQKKEKFEAQAARKGDWWFLKPEKFMNRSGQVVRGFKNFYKIKTKDLIVIHDDLDLALGTWKLQLGVGPKVHNGLLSIQESLGSDQFWRLRLGIDNRSRTEREAIPGEDYVLAKFPIEERVRLEAILPAAWSELQVMLG